MSRAWLRELVGACADVVCASLRGLACACAAGVLAAASPAWAHSASDAYLTLVTATARDGGTAIDGQWDISLRDLDFALSLDADGDGDLTWGEVRRKEDAIARHAFDALRIDGAGSACRLERGRTQVANHADGAYAALRFRIVCAGHPPRIAIDYRLFFALDPSHRGILVFRDGDRVATSLLAPATPRVELGLAAAAGPVRR